jgi:ubiquinone/menaquinone biosynthesis C-methylase UbiE
MRSGHLISLIFKQALSKQSLERRQETASITSAENNVLQYDQVMTTKLAINYAIGLEVIHRTCNAYDQPENALDLACGPGHFTLCLEKYLNFKNVLGLDLSPGMIEVAKKNATTQNVQDKCQFQLADVNNLNEFKPEQFDLTTFADAAHHMPNIQVVSTILKEMERVTKPEGLIVLMDLARFKTENLTEQYINTLASDYISRGLPNFFNDFRDSMYAAWTITELRTCIPNNSNRVWVHLFPKLLPTVQFILGLPVGQKTPFLHSQSLWDEQKLPLTKESKLEFELARMALFYGNSIFVNPS